MVFCRVLVHHLRAHLRKAVRWNVDARARWKKTCKQSGNVRTVTATLFGSVTAGAGPSGTDPCEAVLLAPVRSRFTAVELSSASGELSRLEGLRKKQGPYDRAMLATISWGATETPMKGEVMCFGEKKWFLRVFGCDASRHCGADGA